MRNTNLPVAKRNSLWWTWIAPAITAILSIGGSLALGYALRATEPLGEPLLTLGIIGTFGGIGLGIAVQASSKRNETKRAKGITLFNDSLSSIHSALSTLLKSKRGNEERKVFFDAIVHGADKLFSLEGVRVCIYELDSRESEDGPVGDDEYLRLVGKGGRADLARESFENTSPHGKSAINAAKGTGAICVHDPDNSDHVVKREPNASWKSFFLIPLRGSGSSRGMLTIDTRGRTRFTAEDVAVGQTVARLVVLGMEELVEAATETRPEVTRAVSDLGLSRSQ
ncbi:GAF domain-containing protein [Clavibacter michiganensis]|uniref:GAF domain-containing protein n=1 Tax=Clavibacter michiganensis TaxID=28447 RepID=A0A251YH94_9MICO|nr:GAF domain-containing protein [Clavibacter michiganensis]OUE23617.1 hypothetical protein BFL37_13210 [Clavibacter michiganensis]